VLLDRWKADPGRSRRDLGGRRLEDAGFQDGPCVRGVSGLADRSGRCDDAHHGGAGGGLTVQTWTRFDWQAVPRPRAGWWSHRSSGCPYDPPYPSAAHARLTPKRRERGAAPLDPSFVTRWCERGPALVDRGRVPGHRLDSVAAWRYWSG
jgi:hypothetical protein